MDRLLPWQRQLYECERLICQRDADLSEVRGPGVCMRFALTCTCQSQALPCSNPCISKQPTEVIGHKSDPAGSGKLLLTTGHSPSPKLTPPLLPASVSSPS